MSSTRWRWSWICGATANSVGDTSSTLSHSGERERSKRAADGTNNGAAAEGIGFLGGCTKGDLGFLGVIRVIQGGLDVVDQMTGVTRMWLVYPLLYRTVREVIQGHVVAIESYSGCLPFVEVALVGVHALRGLDALTVTGGY